MAVNSLLKEGRSWSGSERNCCFLNTGGGAWADISAAAGLDQLDDSRAVCVTDWDHDGDLDLWISNRNAPRIRFLRNDVCDNNHWIAVRLQGTTCNRDAIGARVTLRVGSEGKPRELIRTVRAGDAFVSQSSKWIHFGTGKEKLIAQVHVRWPEGTQENFGPLPSNNRFLIVQGTGTPETVAARSREVNLRSSLPAIPQPPGRARIVLASPVPLPGIEFRGFDGTVGQVDGFSEPPTLLNLWSSSCSPCVRELGDLQEKHDRLQAAGLRVIALCVDRIDADSAEDWQDAEALVRREGFSFITAWASSDVIDKMEAIQRALLDVQHPLTLPSSFLLDRHGRVSVIYNGPLSVSQLLADAQNLELEGDPRMRWAMAFDHPWALPPRPMDPMLVAVKLYQGGFLEASQEYTQQLDAYALKRLPGHERIDRAAVLYFQSSLLRARKKIAQATQLLEQVVALSPRHRNANADLAHDYFARRDYPASIRHARTALEVDPDAPRIRTELASALYFSGDIPAAIGEWRNTLSRRPQDTLAANSLAWVLATHPDSEIAQPAEALQLAQQACRATGHQVSQYLRTLAAAHARAQQFDKAIKVSQRALEIDKAAGAKPAVAMTEAALLRYRDNKPLVVSPPRPAKKAQE